jgi:hypothetical protein
METTLQDGLSAGVEKGLGIGLIIGIVFYIAVIVLMIASLWKIFTKAGKPGWAAIIPIYNIIVLLEIVGKPVWWLLLMLIPCVNFIFGIWMINLLSKSYGKNEGYTIGLIILPVIFFPILGFGDATYQGPAGIPKN